MYKYVYVCVYIYIFVYINLSRESIPAINHLVQIKKKKNEHGPSINNKTPCPQPNPWAPLQKKKKTILFKRENKDAALPPFNSTTPLLLFSL